MLLEVGRRATEGENGHMFDLDDAALLDQELPMSNRLTSSDRTRTPRSAGSMEKVACKFIPSKEEADKIFYERVDAVADVFVAVKDR